MASKTQKVTTATAVADFLGLELPSKVTSAYSVAQAIKQKLSEQKNTEPHALQAQIVRLEKQLQHVKAANGLVCSERDKLRAQLRAVEVSLGVERSSRAKVHRQTELSGDCRG